MSGGLKLLPCPFCGEPRVSFNPKLGHRRASINCPGCLVQMPEEAGDDELWQSWNARATAWQPIDTAPNDTNVLMAWLYDGIWEIKSGWAGSTKGCYLHSQATHWMPLPQPPSDQ